MPSHSANVIDLQSYRSRRGLDCAPEAPVASALPVSGMAWVPVWFVPFAFVGVPVATP